MFTVSTAGIPYCHPCTHTYIPYCHPCTVLLAPHVLYSFLAPNTTSFYFRTSSWRLVYYFLAPCYSALVVSTVASKYSRDAS